MKNLRRGLMLFLVVLASGSTMAMGIITVNVIPGKSEKALVSILDAADSKYTVELKDANDELVYYKHAKAPTMNYKKEFDFSNLENGKYTFEIKLGDDTELNKLVVNNGNVQIVDQEEQIAPFFKLNGNLLELSYLDFTNKDMKFKLYDEVTNDLVFEEKIDPEFVVEKAFDLSKLDRSKYDAVLESSDNVYNYEIALN